MSVPARGRRGALASFLRWLHSPNCGYKMRRRAFLAALASAQFNGYGRPSVGRLAESMGCSRATARRELESLDDQAPDWLVVELRDGTAHAYRLIVERLPQHDDLLQIDGARRRTYCKLTEVDEIDVGAPTANCSSSDDDPLQIDGGAYCKLQEVGHPTTTRKDSEDSAVVVAGAPMAARRSGIERAPLADFVAAVFSDALAGDPRAGITEGQARQVAVAVADALDTERARRAYVRHKICDLAADPHIGRRQMVRYLLEDAYHWQTPWESVNIGEDAPADGSPTLAADETPQQPTSTSAAPPSAEHAALWAKVCARLRQWLSDQAVARWLDPLELASVDAGRAVVRCPDRFAAEWADENYTALVVDALADCGAKVGLVDFIYEEPENG